jgi:hypothetical protein
MLHAVLHSAGARRRATGCAVPATAQVAIVFVDYHVELMSVSAWQPILSYIRPVLGVMLVRAVAPTQDTVPAKLVDPRARTHACTHARTHSAPSTYARTAAGYFAPQLLLLKVFENRAALRCTAVRWGGVV